MSEFPETWQKQKLGDVVKTTSGGTPSRKNNFYFGGEIQWFKSGELTDGFLEVSEETITQEGLENSNCKLFPEGTLLMAMYGATVGKLGILKKNASTNQAICALFPSKEIDRDFLFWFLKSKRNELLHNSFGAAQPNISQTVIREIELAFPYVEEQHRIVKRIEDLTRRMEKVRKLRQNTTAEMKSLFFHKSRKIYTSLLSEFTEKPLGKCGRILGGGTPSKQRPDFWDGEIPWVSAKDMKVFFLSDSGLKITKKGLAGSTAKLIPAHSVLFVVRGSILYRYVPVAVNLMPCTINQDLKAIVPGRDINPVFLAHMLQAANDILKGMVEEAANTAGKLPTKSWSELRIPVPEMGKQESVVRELTALQEKLTELDFMQTEASKEFENFQSALLAKAFRGEL
jgi:type I restriction enzyme S subunit